MKQRHKGYSKSPRKDWRKEDKPFKKMMDKMRIAKRRMMLKSGSEEHPVEKQENNWYWW